MNIHIRWVLAVSLLLSQVNGIPKPGPQPVGPPPPPVNRFPPSWDKCFGAALNLKNCLLDAARKHVPGTKPVYAVPKCADPEKRECLQGDLHRVVEGAKNEAVGLCFQQRMMDCADVSFIMTGKHMAGDKQEQERRQKSDALKGLEDLLGGLLTTCQNRTGDRNECLKQAGESFRNTTGKPDSKFSNINFDKERRGAAGKGAAAKIQECFANARTREDKGKCVTSDDARKAAALAGGLNEVDITDADLKRAVNDRAKQFLNEEVSGCVANATTPEEKIACVDRTDELKELLAATKGKSRDEIKDSDVKKFVRESREDSALIAMKACGKTTNKTRLMQCKEDARRAMADASGKDGAKIPDFEINKDVNKAMMRDMSRLMDSCMRLADTVDKKRDCKGAAEEMLKDLNTEEFKGRLENALEDAAKAAVKEAKELCDDADCSQEVRQAIARAKGKRVEDITKLDEKSTMKKAAKAASVEDARACKQAREANATATCEGFYDKFLQRSGKVPPTSPVEEATGKRKMTLEVAETAIKDTLRACFTGPKDELKKCLVEAKEYRKGTVEFMMKEGGINDPRKRQKKEKFAERKAKVATLGELFRACMLEVNATHEGCKVQLKETKDGAEVEDSEEDILDGYYSFSLLTEPVGSCNETEMKDCRRAAKERCLESGMKRRRLIVMQKLAQMRASAEEWAYCLEGLDASTDNVPECKDLAKNNYKFVRGVLGKNFNMTLTKIEDLGRKIVDAIELKLRRKKEVEVNVKTNDTECNDKVLDEFKNKTRDALYVVENASKISYVYCEMVDDEPEYSVKAKVDVPDNQVEDTAAHVARFFAKRRLLDQDSSEAMFFRRLSVSESFAAQSIEEGGNGTLDNETFGTTLSPLHPGTILPLGTTGSGPLPPGSILPLGTTGSGPLPPGTTQPPTSCIEMSTQKISKIMNLGYEPISCN